MTAFPVADRRASRRARRELLRGERWPMAGVLALTVAAAAAGLVAPWLLSRIIGLVEDGGATPDAVDALAGAIVGFALLQLVLTRLARRAAHRMGERATARLRDGLVDRVLALPTGVVERAGTGDLVTRSTADVAAVGATLRDAAPDLLVAAAQVLLVLGAVFLLDPVLGLAAVSGLPIVALGVRWYRRRTRPAYLEHGRASSAVAESMSATAEGAHTAEAYGLADERVRDCDQAVDAVYHTRYRTLALRLRVFLTINLGHVTPQLVVLTAGGSMYFAGRVGLGELVAAVLYVWQLADPVSRVGLWLEQIEASMAAMARIAGVAAPEEPAGGAVPHDDRVRLSGVRFAYVPGRDVLHGIDLAVRPGERLAIVGPSGAGKSTVGRLIAGIDRPREGRVLLGGAPVADIDPAERNRLVVLVTQEHHVFIGTLRENLAIADPDADDAALLAALRTVGWPDADLDAPLKGLPPDKAQLLALARVVLRDPHTVVLDEATSVLDPRSARATERAVAAVLSGRTVIAIAHRLHTAHDADRVAVVDHGRITELGSHDELMAANGPYASLWRSWHG
ncbi:ABC transporter ATP-binding protein [Actinokineospora sp. UTMC 2448]|uniref:ABC transporter ATP-binding protein n=1 Tax=Actinokineospora sp. UTMC 2448 TaxID=2268449 RepID=UPI00216427AF|nr:ABC transporter ATP-binding protein [Actinokineospora sp. UTMC 2448]UVS78041.1 putative multidrug resistance ABC transporter ATP-binding/permease protein YheH [Actinokineospora sp. UTMC 2448]